MDGRQDQIDLDEYSRTGSREALGRLARRHIDFVYSVARREAGDAHLAEDVTQAVFLVLSRKAGKVRAAALSSWLFMTTRHIAANARRAAGRRQFHERLAAARKPESSMQSATDSPDYAKSAILQRHVDEALAAQREGDRSIVLMRYIQGMEVSQISQSLGLSESAARKRLTRAIERLRSLMVRRGVAMDTMAVGTAVAGLSECAPAGLTAAVMGGTASAGGVALAGTAISLPLKAVAAILVIGIAGVVTVGTWLKVWGPGLIATATTGLIADPIPATAPAAAEEPATVLYSGVVEDPGGKPLAGVRIWTEVSAGDPLDAKPLEVQTTTDAQGRYTLPPLAILKEIGVRDDWTIRHIRIDHPDYAIAWQERRAESDRELDQRVNRTSRMQPPTTLPVRVIDADGKPVTGAQVVLRLIDLSNRPNGTSYGYFDFPSRPDSVKTDALGIVEFTRIPKYARAHVKVSHPDFQTIDSLPGYSGGTFPVRPGGGAFVVTLERGGQVRLKIPVVNGKPLFRAAHFGAIPDPPAEGANAGKLAVLEADGHYLWSGLKPGRYKVGVLRPLPADQGDRIWLPVRGVEVELGKTTEVNVEPVVGRLLTGRIIDKTTRLGLKDIGVSISTAAPELQPWYGSAKTGPDGRFSARVPVGEVRLQVASYPQGHYAQVESKITVPAEGNASAGDIEVFDRPMARGRLVDASGKPIAGTVHYEFGKVTSAADGSFAIEAPKDTPDYMEILAFNGDKTLGSVMRMDSKFLNPRLALPGADLPIITLRATCVIAGEIVDKDSKPVSDASVWLYMDDANGDGSSSLDPRAISLARDGNKFIFSSVPAGNGLSLSVDATGARAYAKLENLNPGEIRDLGAVALQPNEPRDRNGGPAPVVAINRDFTGSVSGRIVDTAGQPLVGIRVTAAPDGDLGSQHDDYSDHEGKFIVERMPRGEKLMLFVRSQVHQPFRGEAREGDQNVEVRLMGTAADLIGNPAPELALSNWLVGEPTTLEELRGKVALLEIGVDVTEFGYGNYYESIKQLHEANKEKGLVVIAIHKPPGSARPRPTSLEAIRQYVAEKQIPFPMAVDSRVTTRPTTGAFPGETHLRYGVKEPAYILIDKKGIVRASPPWNEVTGWVTRLLAE